jgi:hypothetical protein
MDEDAPAEDKVLTNEEGDDLAKYNLDNYDEDEGPC